MVVGYRLEGQSVDGYEGDIEVVELKEVNKLLDNIEEKARLALEYIEDIEGINSIDRCKKVIREIIDGIA